MNLDEFESQYRDTMDETLNQLQTATLLVAQVQAKIAEIGRSVQNISLTVEEFITQQKSD